MRKYRRQSALLCRETSKLTREYRARSVSVQVLDFTPLDVVTHPPEVDSDMATAAELTTKVAALEERVTNHIRFFWVVVAFGFVWLGALSTLMIQIKGSVDRVEKTQTANFQDLNNKIAVAQLTALKSSIETAQKTHEIISKPELADYKQTLKELPPSASGYWTTVAAIINYQSLINQMNNQAPDPAIVSQPCPGLTQGSGGDNVFRSEILSGCVVDLDSTHNALVDITFKNSVIRYHGGPLTLSNVRFENCRFVLDIPVTAPANPERNRFLMTLFEAPHTTAVTVASTQS
jgi:hypothetical protein